MLCRGGEESNEVDEMIPEEHGGKNQKQSQRIGKGGKVEKQQKKKERDEIR
jgi:hypothetical protein